MKDRDSESRTQLRSDSDNRSHVSGMSSHPSHSSQSQSTTSQSHSQKSRRGSYDRLQFPRHDLVTIGMLGKLTLQCFFAFIVLPIQNIMAGIFFNGSFGLLSFIHCRFAHCPQPGHTCGVNST